MPTVADQDGEIGWPDLEQQRDTALFDLGPLALVRVSGEDAATFLNAQFVNDIQGIGTSGSQLNAWCNHKGQVIAVLILCHFDGCFFILLPVALRQKFILRLSQYVLRAQVKITDVSDQYIRLGGMSLQAIETLLGGIHWHHRETTSTYRLIQSPDRSSRYLLIINPNNVARTDQTVTYLPYPYWQLLDIKSAMPWLVQGLDEQFLPQTLNLDLLGGMRLDKGCFPGQEIIARLHYRGKIKHRLVSAMIADGLSASLAAGDPVLDQKTSTPVASIFSSCQDSAGQTHLLLVLETTRFPQQAGEGTLVTQTGEPLRLALPAYMPAKQPLAKSMIG